MRRLALLLCAAALLAAGCKRRQHPNPAATIEEEGELASAIDVAEPKDATQLISGFYAVEGGANPASGSVAISRSPFSSRKAAPARKPARSLPSTNGWFLIMPAM